jgi:predicted P-loop ATPase
VPASELVRAIGRKVLVSAVARVERPGCKVDHMLILEGPQGTLKSKALRALAGDAWFTDQIADLGTKDSSQDLKGVWLVEISELSAIRPGEVEKVKAYISRQVDHYRPSYGRHSIDVPRQNVFVGTTNDAEYLSDSTGGRRFWPICCTNIDVEALARDRDQLWAEAVARFKSGENWWLDANELRSDARKEQEHRRIADPWESIIATWLDHPATKPDREGVRLPIVLKDGRVTVAQLLEHAICKPSERQSKSDQMRVGKILKLFGWKKRKTDGNVVWEPGDPDGGTEATPQGVPNGEVSSQGVPAETRKNGGQNRGRDTSDTYTGAHTHARYNPRKFESDYPGRPGVPDWPDAPPVGAIEADETGARYRYVGGDPAEEARWEALQ